MAHNQRKDETTPETPAAPKAPETGLTVAAPAAAPVAVSLSGGDPDRVVATVDIGGIPAAVTARDAQRAVSGGMRTAMRAIVKSSKLAADHAAGLVTMGEIEAAHGNAAALDVKIECRRRGMYPLTAAAPKGE